VSKDVGRRPIFLENRELALRRISVDNPQMAVKMVVRPIAKLSE
jgi:hypothetical protein